MNYTIITDRDNSSLKWFLEGQKFKISDSTTNSIVLNLSNKKLNKFINVISIYISTIYYSDIYKSLLSSKLSSIEYRVINKIATLDIENNDNKFYIVNNLRILLIEYFKSNNLINIDSFIMFNCNGLKKDINFLAEMYCDSCEDFTSLISSSRDSEISLDFKDESLSDEEIEDLIDFEYMTKDKKGIIDIPTNLSSINRLDILMVDDTLTFLANDDFNLDIGLLKNILLDSLVEPCEHIFLYMLVGTIALLNIEKIVIHRNLNSSNFEYILKCLLDIKGLGGLISTNIFKCKIDNCSKCNLNTKY